MRLFFFMFFGLTIFRYSFVHAEYGEVLHKFQRLNQLSKYTCEGDKKAYSSTPLNLKEFYRSQNCKTLLSLGPPENVKKTKSSGIFKDPYNWSPICASTFIKQYQVKGQTFDQAVASTNQYIKGADLCSIPSANRYSSDYHIPTQKERKLKVMNHQEIEKLKQTFVASLEIATKICCGSDQDCSTVMKKVDLVACKPEKDPNKPDRCIGSGIFYQGYSDKGVINHVKIFGLTPEVAREIKGKLKVYPGQISVSPFSGQNSIRGFRHELGHACSGVRRQLAVFQGKMAELGEYSSAESCIIGKNTYATYDHLHRKMGLSSDSSACFVTRAKTADRQRFYPQKKCENGCARMQLEESYAKYFVFLSTPEKDWIPEGVMEFCNGCRDSQHPLGSDVLRCLLKTPSIVSKLQGALQCKN